MADVGPELAAYMRKRKARPAEGMEGFVGPTSPRLMDRMAEGEQADYDQRRQDALSAAGQDEYDRQQEIAAMRRQQQRRTKPMRGGY